MVGVVLGDFESYALTYVPYSRTVFPREEDIPEAITIVVSVDDGRRLSILDARCLVQCARLLCVG